MRIYGLGAHFPTNRIFSCHEYVKKVRGPFWVFGDENRVKYLIK